MVNLAEKPGQKGDRINIQLHLVRPTFGVLQSHHIKVKAFACNLFLKF